MNSLEKFIKLKNCNRIWAIGSIHGNLIGIENIHKYISNEFKANDKIIYLGNVIGVGERSRETINEIIEFRSKLMAKFKLAPENFIFLRGAQEEMLSKLLELQISPNPKEVLLWIFEHGVDKTLFSYKINYKEILDICELGSVAISKWTSKTINQINTCKGHNEYYSNLIHAAFSDTKEILFLNRGVDITRPLSAQNDCFWWGYHNFSKINKPYYTFKKIVRGYDPKKTGPLKDTIVCSLYKGSGFNGQVVAGLFSSSGDIIDIFEA